MTLIPRSIPGRLAAVAWILACLGLLAFAWMRRDLRGMPEAFALIMGFVALPASLVIAPIAGIATTAIERAFGIPYDPFVDIVPLWITLSVGGYFQWFVLLPGLWRKGAGKKIVPP